MNDRSVGTRVLATDGAAELVEGPLSGHRRTPARAISNLEREDPEMPGIVERIYPKTEDIQCRQEQHHSQAYRAVSQEDTRAGVVSAGPLGPFSKGTILGARIWISDRFLDPGKFIGRWGAGDVWEGSRPATMAMECASMDVMLYKMVDVGQGGGRDGG